MAENQDLAFIYDPIKEKMREEISQISYSTFVDKLVPVEIDGRIIVLESPTEGIAAQVSEILADKIRDAIIRADVGLNDFRIKVAGSSVYAYNPPEQDIPAAPTNLDKRYTFESFVVGKSYAIGYRAALAVADNPAGTTQDNTYNPLFIYGGTGLGKTHLIQAIANKVVAEKPELRVIYTTCEQFVNDIIDNMFASRGQDSRDKSKKLRDYYRSADLLIIDDIQFIENKKAVQEEFFHTFNELVSRHKQIVITSDHSPKELTQLEERLRTRFSGGLVIDIQPPSFETKIAILKRKAFERKTLVPDDVLQFIATGSGDDIRSLEGRLSKVIFASKLHESPITVELAKSALEEAVPEVPEEATPESVISAVTSYYKVSKTDLLGKCKKKEVVIPRQVCCYLMCDVLSLPLISIGQYLGGRDHTTVIYSRDKVEEMMKTNDKIAKDVDDIKNIILKK